MPYSRPLIPDRSALGRFTYQLRKFQREIRSMGIPPAFEKAVDKRLTDLENLLKGGAIDYDEDTTVLDSPGNREILQTQE